ncbi:MAG: tetratricopeptide repeat protein [Gemmatimonadetes bacterium]|nr:tetratricopeptide repeat protein [Gemmatimonadota bacterium]
MFLLLPLVGGGCGSDPSEETASLRGDLAFARGDYEEALSEYRLSLLRDDPGAGGLVRAAHAYIELGRVDEARGLYDQAILEDSSYVDQAVSDFVARAKQELANGDRYGAASAMEAATHFRPGVLARGLNLPLARHYRDSGEHLRAQALFLSALGERRGDPDLLFETALAHLEIGDCQRALGFFEEFASLVPRREQETYTHVGRCAFQLAEEIAEGVGEEGAAEEALAYLDLVLELGEPRMLLSRAWFTKAEILVGMGECAAAISAYRMVQDSDAAGSGPLSRTALQRADEIRFGRGEGPC